MNPGMGAVFEMKGPNSFLQAYETHVAISPRGILGLMGKGLKGTKELPYRSIVAVQFKDAGAVFSGFLQFTIAGGNESKGGLFAAANDENTFMFAEKKNNEQARLIKEYIDGRITALHSHQPMQSGASLSDELAKLASLRDQGVLSDAEFVNAKARLIG